MKKRRSSSVLKDMTILRTAAAILKRARKPIGPSEIAERGKRVKLLRVPRGRTRAYLSQLIQSVLYNDSHYRRKPIVARPRIGLYRVRKSRR